MTAEEASSVRRIEMTAEESLQRYGLVPRGEDLVVIRDLLASEVDAEHRGLPRQEDLVLLCCVQLFSRGGLTDVLRIWEAKCSGIDLGGLVDVQFLCGAGLAETRQFLEQSGKDAAAALEYIDACEQAGDFEGFSPAKHLEDYKRYFGVA